MPPQAFEDEEIGFEDLEDNYPKALQGQNEQITDIRSAAAASSRAAVAASAAAAAIAMTKAAAARAATRAARAAKAVGGNVLPLSTRQDSNGTDADIISIDASEIVSESAPPSLERNGNSINGIPASGTFNGTGLDGELGHAVHTAENGAVGDDDQLNGSASSSSSFDVPDQDAALSSQVLRSVLDNASDLAAEMLSVEEENEKEEDEYEEDRKRFLEEFGDRPDEQETAAVGRETIKSDELLASVAASFAGDKVHKDASLESGGASVDMSHPREATSAATLADIYTRALHESVDALSAHKHVPQHRQHDYNNVSPEHLSEGVDAPSEHLSSVSTSMTDGDTDHNELNDRGLLELPFPSEESALLVSSPVVKLAADRVQQAGRKSLKKKRRSLKSREPPAGNTLEQAKVIARQQKAVKAKVKSETEEKSWWEAVGAWWQDRIGGGAAKDASDGHEARGPHPSSKEGVDSKSQAIKQDGSDRSWYSWWLDLFYRDKTAEDPEKIKVNVVKHSEKGYINLTEAESLDSSQDRPWYMFWQDWFKGDSKTDLSADNNSSNQSLDKPVGEVLIPPDLPLEEIAREVAKLKEETWKSSDAQGENLWTRTVESNDRGWIILLCGLVAVAVSLLALVLYRLDYIVLPNLSILSIWLPRSFC